MAQLSTVDIALQMIRAVCAVVQNMAADLDDSEVAELRGSVQREIDRILSAQNAAEGRENAIWKGQIGQ